MSKQSAKLLMELVSEEQEPISATAADLATVRMDARYHVLDIHLHNRSLQAEGEAAEATVDHRLEVALKEAFNEALHKVMERNAARLADLVARGSTEEPATAPDGAL